MRILADVVISRVRLGIALVVVLVAAGCLGPGTTDGTSGSKTTHTPESPTTTETITKHTTVLTSTSSPTATNSDTTSTSDGDGIINNTTTNGSQEYALIVTVRRVTENSSGPISNASVQISSQSSGSLSGIFGSNEGNAATTGSEGKVRAQLPNGSYTVSVQADGYGVSEKNITINGSDRYVTIGLDKSSAITNGTTETIHRGQANTTHNETPSGLKIRYSLPWSPAAGLAG